MNALRNWKQIWPLLAMWLGMTLVVTIGCKDLASPEDAPALNKLTSNTLVSEANDTSPASTALQPDAAPREVLPQQAAPKKSIAIPAAMPDEIYEPKVVLGRSHEQTCLVNVGDTMPNLALQSLTGEPVTLDKLRADKLTVVVFWSNRHAFGREQFQRLAAEVALPFHHLGVKVVAVNVGDLVEQIELDEVTRAEVACVLDPDGSAAAQVATSKLPRTYLVDGKGRILWFDIEYSRTTRRQLKNAIFYFSRDETVLNGDETTSAS